MSEEVLQRAEERREVEGKGKGERYTQLGFPAGSSYINIKEEIKCKELHCIMCFPGDSDGKEPACNAGDPGSIPESGRSPGGGHGYPLRYSCLENPMNRGAWKATVQGVAQSQTQYG